jgi:type III secretion system low calcium response chaperone LcrH/SycD
MEVEESYANGYAQYNAGNFTAAVDVFRNLCLEHPSEHRFWFALGATLQEAGSYDRALRSWAMAALLDGSNPYPHFHAAECCLSLQKREDAAKALKESELRIIKRENHPLVDKIEVLKQQWRF